MYCIYAPVKDTHYLRAMGHAPCVFPMLRAGRHIVHISTVDQAGGPPVEGPGDPRLAAVLNDFYRTWITLFT